MVEAERVYRQVKASFEDIIGLPREKILGKHLAGIVGWELFQTVIKAGIAHVPPGESAAFEQWRNCPIKDRTYLRVSHVLYWKKREVAGIAITIRDLTEPKDTKHRSLANGNAGVRLQGSRI